MKWTTVLGALGCILLTGYLPSRGVYEQLRRSLVEQTDRQLAPIMSLLHPIFSFPVQWQRSYTTLTDLERSNRQLYIQWLSCNQQVATAAAQQQAPHGKRAILSQTAAGWIILSGKDEAIETQDWILLDGVYLGTVTAVYPSYALIDTVRSQSMPLLVMHDKTKTTGFLTHTHESINVSFTKVIPSLQPEDIITSVPDGSHTKQALPVGVVKHIQTTPSDSVSEVSLRPLADPRVSQVVEVIGGLR